MERIVRRHGRRQLARVQARRSPARALRYAAQRDPTPLLDRDRRLMVLWTPKVASSTLAIWFWTVTGVRAEARAFSPDPHRYRQRVHYPSAAFGRALADDLRSYTVVKVVRDPHRRAVSSYRHALRQGYYDATMARRLGRAVDEHAGYSFAEYLDLLADLKPRDVNPHDRLQRHPVERHLRPTHLIRLGDDDLFDALAAVDASRGFGPIGLRDDEWVALVEGRRSPGSVAPGSGPDQRHGAAQARAGGEWPASEELLTPTMRSRVAELYRSDIEAYFP